MEKSGFQFDPKRHIYLLKGRRLWSVTERLAGLGLIDTEWYTEAAKIRGKAVHLAMQYLQQGGLDWSSIKATEAALGIPVEPYVRAGERFLRESGWRAVQVEVAGYHPLYEYGFCTDNVGFWPDGQEGIVDWKTGASADWWQLQLGAYDEAAPRLSSHGARRKTCVQLKIDGNYQPHHLHDQDAGRLFLAMQATHAWGLSHGRYTDDRPVHVLHTAVA